MDGMITRKPGKVLLLGALMAAAVAYDHGFATQPDTPTAAGIRTTPVTIAVAERGDLELWESSVGQLEARVAPLISAEVAGRLTVVDVDVGDQVTPGQRLAEIDATDFELARDMAQADIERLQALIHAQQLNVDRYRALVQKKSANQSTLDDAQAQLRARRAELTSAQVRLQQARRDIGKTRITSPVEGRVDETMVSEGDYVKVGAPLVRIASLGTLRARLPYPETLLSRLHPGLPVRLSSPSVPGETVETTVSEVRPSITIGSRSAQVIVNVDNPGSWDPGATVTGSVRLARHKDAVLIPEISLIRRPAGTVVYILDGDKAIQRVVTPGLRRAGQVEITSGLQAGERVVADGAGFLTDGAPVTVKSP